jgi:1-deoxy-D-xylulose-5-phosphate synthase
VAISAAMIDGTGLVDFQKRFPDRCLDVGMAEQHGVALAAGLALAGQRPICAIYSTFLQRAYDQLFQEVALQRATVLFCIDRAGLVGSDGATHNGVFDIGYLRCLPGFLLMSPRDPDELARMMELAWLWRGPVAIRYPRGAGARPELRLGDSPLALGRAERLAPGADGAILAYGPQAYAALELRRRVRNRLGRTLAVVNARFAKPLDASLIELEWRRQPVLFTLEDHSIACGFGSAVAELGATRLRGRVDARKLYPLGLPDRFIDHGERVEQLEEGGLTLGALEARIVARLEERGARRSTVVALAERSASSRTGRSGGA